MDCETGRVYSHKEAKKLNFISQQKLIPINKGMATPKQRRERQVSPHDGRSVLGKLRVKHGNRLRNEPCPCGSGNKFKKCCWSKVA